MDVLISMVTKTDFWRDSDALIPKQRTSCHLMILLLLRVWVSILEEFRRIDPKPEDFLLPHDPVVAVCLGKYFGGIQIDPQAEDFLPPHDPVDAACLGKYFGGIQAH